jgi:predicted AlkP superfamily phosphohydrolase/phosphomutase
MLTSNSLTPWRSLAVLSLLPLLLSTGCFRLDDSNEKEAATPERTPSAPIKQTPSRREAPLVMVGIDGADWKVIEALWEQGKLPNLERLAKEGTWAPLKTAYGESPVIWNTIATGRTPEEHGITGFVVPTAEGTVPVSSSVRRVPALWNMTSRAGFRTAVLGWWASWPAEEINGVMVTDRAHFDLDRIVFPEEHRKTFDEERRLAANEYPDLSGQIPSPDPWVDDGALRDRIMAHEALRLVQEGFDLFLVYLRAVDIVSHRYWKYHEPQYYGEIPAAELAAHEHVIPTVYEATDRVIGDLVAKCPEGTNILVVSDHGFFAGPEQRFVNLRMDNLLEHLGFLVRDGEKVDFARSVAYPVDTPAHERVKKIRLSLRGREPDGTVDPDSADSELDRLARALEQARYEDGNRVFTVRRTGLPPGADLVAEVSFEEPSMRIWVGEESLDDVVFYINRISGTHNENTKGIIVAWGPDLEPGTNIDGISVVDLAPTILYALGLPAAEDFAGRIWTELFTEAFRSEHPPRTVPTWGTLKDWEAEKSEADQELIDELRALGYL